MDLRVITPPTVEPVTLTEAKAFLRVDGTAEDTLITSLIVAARERGEELSRRAFLTQTLEMTVDCLPSQRTLALLRPPLISVTSVTYRDYYGVSAVWTDYRTDTNSQPGKIIFTSKPGVYLQESGAVTIRYVAGYGSAASAVPERIKNAILQLVAQWYENRGATNEMPMSSKEAFLAERVVWF